MKTTALRNWTAVCVTVMAATAGMRVLADQPATAVKREKTWTGTIVSLDPKERLVKLKGFFFEKKFNLGDNCTYTFVGKGEGAMGDLHPGQRVKVGYQNAHGVLVANRLEQLAMLYEGTVKAIIPEKRSVTLRLLTTEKTFDIPDDCKVVLRDDKTGKLADVQLGHRVTVTYETPGGMLTLRQIAQRSATFIGTVTAIDVSERTVKAKATFGTKKFNLSDQCLILVNSKPDAQLSDLKPGDKLVFSYDELNGINVANRIASPETPAPAMTARSSQ